MFDDNHLLHINKFVQLQRLELKIKSKRLFLDKATSLYDYLEQIGYTRASYPSNGIDRLATKYKLLGYFYTPKMSSDHRLLTKNGIVVFFDDWNVDIVENGKTTITFGKRATTKEINDYLSHREREIKLERILKNSKNVT
jgi:hypothetical protein